MAAPQTVRRLTARHGRDESASSPWAAAGPVSFQRRASLAGRNHRPSNDNLDRMTAKLVSTPTLGRALRFWREHYVADRERGSWSSAVRDLSPLSIARTADRDHDHVVAPVLQMHQLRVRVVRCALVRRGRRSHRRAIAVDLCRAAALITPRRHDIRRVSRPAAHRSRYSRSSRPGFATTGAVPVGSYGQWRAPERHRWKACSDSSATERATNARERTQGKCDWQQHQAAVADRGTKSKGRGPAREPD